MTQDDLTQIVYALKDCNDYLEGRVHSEVLQQIAKKGADEAVKEYRQMLMLDLQDAGLIIEDYP